jgi:hypothetical protein
VRQIKNSPGCERGDGIAGDLLVVVTFAVYDDLINIVIVIDSMRMGRQLLLCRSLRN